MTLPFEKPAPATVWNTPTRENRKRKSTPYVRDDFMYTIDGLRRLHTRMEAQRAIAAAKIEEMEDGKDKLELSVMLLAFASKQATILDQIADMEAKKEIRQAKLAGRPVEDDLPF